MPVHVVNSVGRVDPVVTCHRRPDVSDGSGSLVLAIKYLQFIQMTVPKELATNRALKSEKKKGISLSSILLKLKAIFKGRKRHICACPKSVFRSREKLNEVRISDWSKAADLNSASWVRNSLMTEDSSVILLEFI